MGVYFKAKDAFVPLETIDKGEIHNSGLFQPTYIPKFTTPEEFVDAKIEILREHLCIELTEEDIARLKACNTEVQINNMVRTIISEHWR